ncbi:ABC transporter substrate-binding protein SapA [Vibrio plantisponsor]|uniref:ABC transporter substrate-binding protein SapA n=1 Tax=Vibrio plantisponsor TaxID=664643 RepID=A0ABU4IFF1_9VIBR|nr:ABC transporter substrate-binding protein SapA [Vibrio plantisponsor]MDW6017292.1 ABC transporter substrate-binding protein SapA [Vibrio plantisponsor]NNM40234.1 peptide ABC transporter substrate-binding protein SapA [Vibrio plantisponsor]PNH87778.1 peptide ABC transporter substrate-binding protein SapA [Vibrio diazotrophicus]
MNTLLRITLGLCGLSLLAGCGEEIDHTKIRQSGFVYCGQGSPSTFNPQLVDSGITSEALSPQLYDTLLKLDPDTHTPIPNIATQWQVSEDGTEYTFNLRSGVNFHTTSWFTPTRTMNAKDVVFSFKRIIDPTHPYHYVSNGNYPWFAGINFRSLLKSVTAIDDQTVKFTLSRPDNSFLSNISTTHAVILSEEYAQQLQIKDEKHNIDEFPVGTGPFFLDEFKVNDLVRLRRHEGYWNNPAIMKQVVFDISQRGTGTLAKLLRNECDVLSFPISSQIPVIQKQENIDLSIKPAMNVAFIAVNTSHPALNDVRVRKALNFAINRQNILDSVYYGTGSIAYNILPPSSWAYQKDDVQIRYDRNYALGLLRDAGYANGLELSMSVPIEPRSYNPSPRKMAEMIQSNLADVGVTLHLIPESNVNRSQLAEKSHIDLFLRGWTGDTGDPDNFLRPLLSCGANRAGLNASMWCNSDFDFLLDLALEVDRPRYRLNLYKQAQTILNQEFPVIPIAHGMQFKAYNKTLTGFRLSPFSVEPFNNVKRITE